MILVVLAAFVVVLGIEWSWMTDGESGSAVVRNIGLVVAAAIALPLAVWRSRIAERQADTEHRSMLDERFHKALERLGSSDTAIQLTGVHTLRRLANEHPDEYGDQVAEAFDALTQAAIGDGQDGE